MIAGYIGLTYLTMNKVKEATVLLEEAGQAEQPLVMVSFHLGAMAHQRGDLATAERYLLKEIEFHPEEYSRISSFKRCICRYEKLGWDDSIGAARIGVTQHRRMEPHQSARLV